MAFKEASASALADGPAKTGLPKNWSALKEAKCPSCSDDLVEFEHLKLFKCACGFKISEFRFSEILRDLDKPKARSCGFSKGNYHDESPF